MKIIELKFYNINNLKGGPHIISFNKSPLSNAGLFAIIGPTGSGKSTILDVITLALFNRIPRFKKSISKGEINELGSVITHHTDSAYASITYEVNQTQYTSKWSIEKARTGNLKDYEMHISDGAGNYLDIKKSDVPAKNEEIIGLDYSQFVKSIILSQGQFSKFLKADKNERGQLLENITGSNIYRKLGKEAYTRYVQYKKQADLLNELLNEIQVLNDEKITELKNNISNFEIQQKNYISKINKLSSILQIKKEILELKKSISLNKINAEKIETDIRNFQPELLKLVTHEKLSPQKDDIVSYRLAKNNARQTKTNIEKYQRDLEIANNQLERTIQKMGNLTQENVTIQNFINIMSSFEKEIQKMDSDIENIRSNGATVRNRINQKINDLHIGLEHIKNPEEALKIIEEYKSKLNAILYKAGFDYQTVYQEQRNIIKNIQEDIRLLQDYLKVKEQLIDLTKNRNIVNEKIEINKNSILNTSPLYTKTEATYQALKANEINLQKRKEDALKIANLENLRQTLIDGDPCPLCGSESHPYTEHVPINHQSKIDIEIAENNRLILKEHKELNDLDKIITATNTSLNHNQNTLNEINVSIENIENNLDKIQVKLTNYKDLKTDELRNTIDTLIKKSETIDEATIALQNLKLSEEVAELYKELQNILITYQELNSKRNKRYKGQDPSKECNVLQDQFNIHNTSKTENTKALEIEMKDYDRSLKMLDHIEKKLQPKLHSLGLETIEEMDNKFLSEVEFDNIKTTHEKLTKENTTISTALLNDEKKLKEKEQNDIMQGVTISVTEEKINSLAQLRDQLNKSIGENTAKIQQDAELRKRRKEKEKEIQKVSKLVEKWSIVNQLIGDATGNKFANFAQGLTLQNLLVYTNKRLLNLTDRYLIDMPKGEGALTVIDQYQGNTVRSVSTLSGGETFLISLALALSLSDMASKNISLESLFIDEGFGTLDQETLDLALDTLEKLQSESQKTVGIISHVEALKERINVQIKLEKNAQGYSHIEIVS